MRGGLRAPFPLAGDSLGGVDLARGKGSHAQNSLPDPRGGSARAVFTLPLGRFKVFLPGGFALYPMTHSSVSTSETLTQDKVTIQEACKIAKVSRKTLYRWIEKGLLSRVKEENRAYISLAEVRALCNQGDTQDDTGIVSGDIPMTQQDTNRVTLDRQHYEGLLIKLGQYEAERRYLLEYKAGLEAKDKELAETKENLTAQAQDLAETKATLQARETELAQIREEVQRLRLPWWKRWFHRR